MFKLQKSNQKILAILITASLATIPTITTAKNKITAYYDDSGFVIDESSRFSLTISLDELNALLNYTEEDLIRIKVGENNLEIDKITLLELKEKAENERKELDCYITIIYTAAGVITSLIIKSTLKEEIKKRK